MGRQLRIEYAGACYHVMSRGNGGNEIFKDDRDRLTFLKTLWECCEQTGWLIHAYVLMGNHYHLLIETPEANLVAGMKWFQGTYTKRFNARHHLWGHLYQGRYKSLIIDDEESSYFQTVSTYIHLNPVRAGLIYPESRHVESYQWSSLSCYSQRPARRPPALALSRVLGNLNLKDRAAGRKAYLEWIQKRALEELDKKYSKELAVERKPLKRGWCMGTEDFKEKIMAFLGDVSSDNYRGDQRRDHGVYMAEKLIEQGLNGLKCTIQDIEHLRQNHIHKQALAWLVKRNTTVTGEWIRQKLNMGGKTNVSRALSRFDCSTEPEVIKLKKKMRKWAG